MAYYLTLKDWTKFPKTYSAIHVKHSSQLQSLIELEEGFRVRESRDSSLASHPTILIESLSKNASMVINQWYTFLFYSFKKASYSYFLHFAL